MMKDIADWLIHIENISGQFYREAAAYFKDPDLAAFLERCGRDESRHADLIHAAADTLENHPEIKTDLLVDEQIRDAIEAPFRDTQANLSDRTLTREQLIDCIVETEFSEWNDIFLYVVHSLTAIKPEFKTVAIEMQNHLKHVELFLAATEYGQRKIEKLQGLPPVWRDRILIIEDDRFLAELFTSVLQAEGRVDAAHDGQTGLAKILQHFYGLIVSDVNMPGMDGITLYRQASRQFPNIGKRYLFLTGNPSPEIIAFFNDQKLKYLTKPAGIREIHDMALSILNRNSAN